MPALANSIDWAVCDGHAKTSARVMAEIAPVRSSIACLMRKKDSVDSASLKYKMMALLSKNFVLGQSLVLQLVKALAPLPPQSARVDASTAWMPDQSKLAVSHLSELGSCATCVTFDLLSYQIQGY